jgi:hypothetical protein
VSAGPETTAGVVGRWSDGVKRGDAVATGIGRVCSASSGLWSGWAIQISAGPEL